MTINRSFLLGIGSGLMLSALLALSFSLLGYDLSPASINSNQNQASVQQNSLNHTLPTLAEEAKESAPVEEVKQPLDKQIVIPVGTSSEQIAELLFSQGLITDKSKFLETVEKREVAGKFQSGTFSLVPGLNHDEIINRLIRQ